MKKPSDFLLYIIVFCFWLVVGGIFAGVWVGLFDEELKGSIQTQTDFWIFVFLIFVYMGLSTLACYLLLKIP